MNSEQFAVETAIGLIKPFHRVECHCDRCVGWLQIEFCKQGVEIERLQEENVSLRWEIRHQKEYILFKLGK